MASDLAIIEAPTTLGLWPSGVQLLAATLLEHGLAERLGAGHGGSLVTPPYVRERDPHTGFLNGPAVRQYALELERLLVPQWNAGLVPVVLGGDCSILHGALVGLKRRGRTGLLYLDGHADFYRGTTSQTGEIADMGLAIAVGRNDPLLSDIDGLAAYVQPEDSVLFGFRDEAESLSAGMQGVRGSGVHCFDLQAIRRIGSDAAIEQAVNLLSGPRLDAGVFIHFDTDVLDDAVNPAVDYRMADGLAFDEVSRVIAAVRRTGRLRGISVSIFNPRLDPGGRVAKALTDCIVAGLRA